MSKSRGCTDLKTNRAVYRIAAALVAATLACAPSAARAQAGWKPERAVEIVVPTTPGGAIDGAARTIQRILQANRLVAVPLVVVNKPGGGQTIAMNYLDQRTGDPHCFIVSTMSIMTNHILARAKTNYTDYTALAVLYGEPMTLVVKPDSPLKSGRDIQDRLKKDPKSLSLAIGIALGGTNHLSVALVMRAMGIDVKNLKTVVFQANADTQTALMGGHVDLAPLSLATAQEAMVQGKVRILGISMAQRGDGPLADIPTWKEQGFDVQFTNTRFLLAPKGLSAAQAAYWDGVIARMVETEEWKADAKKNDLIMDFQNSKQSPERLAAMYKQLKMALVDVGLAKE
jgi:putative tricarboxylic transport membrane protein